MEFQQCNSIQHSHTLQRLAIRIQPPPLLKFQKPKLPVIDYFFDDVIIVKKKNLIKRAICHVFFYLASFRINFLGIHREK